MNFATSTHHASLMTAAELTQKRSLANTLPKGEVARCLVGLASSDVISDLPPATNDAPSTDADADITPADELALVSFYASNIFDLCSPTASFPLTPELQPKIRRSETVPSLANVYLRRFYASNSVKHYDPATILVSCVFLASKIEDQTIDSRNLESATESLGKRVPVAEIISHEVAVLAAQNFQLHCSHPFRPLKAFVEDARKYCVEVKEWYTKSTCPDFLLLYKKAEAWLNEVSCLRRARHTPAHTYIYYAAMWK
jgi:cyclin H